MKFQHQISIDAPRAVVFEILSDFPRAARLMPDVGEVRELEDGTYEGTMRVRIGPIGLNLTGNIEIAQDDSLGRWSMQAKAQDRRVGGGVVATIDVTLTETSENSSELNVSADVQFMGRLGELGQPLIKRKADSSIKSFSENIKKEVADSG